MSERLILIRHGKAEDHDIRKDFDRELTQKGIEEIEQMAPELAKRIDGRDTVIITSPLVRAKQTADLLAEAIAAPVEVENWVADGVYSKVLATQKRQEHVVILVGHNPDCDRWHVHLTGEEQHFKKGAAAMYRWTEEGKVRLEWMKTAKQIAKGDIPDEA